MKDTLFRLSMACLLVGIAAAIFAPAEKTLGKILSLIYLHIGFVYGALLLFLVSTFSAAVFLLRRRLKFLSLSETAFRLAFVAWVVYLVLSALIAIMSWGSINWQEPRWIIGVNIFFFSMMAVLVAWWLGREKAVYLYLPAGILFVLYWSTRTSQLHPYAPIRMSESAAIKATAVVSVVATVISLLLLALAIVQREVEA